MLLIEFVKIIVAVFLDLSHIAACKYLGEIRRRALESVMRRNIFVKVKHLGAEGKIGAFSGYARHRGETHLRRDITAERIFVVI